MGLAHKIVFDEGGFVAAHAQSMLIQVWGTQPQMHQVQSLDSSFDRMAERWPDGFFLLDVIAQTASPPEAIVRRRAAETMATLRGRALAMAHVVKGDSMQRTVVRTVLRGYHIMSRQPVPTKIVASAHVALGWFDELQRLGPTMITDLEHLVTELERRARRALARAARRTTIRKSSVMQ